MKLKLPDDVFSSQDLMTLIVEIGDFRRQFAQHTIQSKVGKTSTKLPDLSPSAQQLIDSCTSKKPINRSDVDTLIAELEKIKRTSRTITITLAAPASGDIKQSLVSWCRKNLHDGILVNFSFNSNLLGGLIVRMGSHIYDWSWRRQLLESTPKFTEALARV